MRRSDKVLDQQIGERMRTIRRLRGMTQRELGSAIDVSFQQIQKYEQGTNGLSVTRLVELARILGISISDLLEAPASTFFLELERPYLQILQNLRFLERTNQEAFSTLCKMVVKLAPTEALLTA